MSRFEVDSARVGEAGAAVQASAQQIGVEVERMMRHLLDLQASWQGQDPNNPTSGGGMTLHLVFPAADTTDNASPYLPFVDEEILVVYLANNQGADTL